ncbi:hypothetical protein C0993_010544 [Termitomyces sp. T159_Od127]|nr:hypothetical protein C0993_010544 [Termitomyces sp. T159_Od127]
MSQPRPVRPWEHNPEIDWAQGKESRKECLTTKKKRAAIQACQLGYLPFADLDLLSPPLLAYPPQEVLYEDNWHCREYSEQEEALGEEF